MHLRASTLKLLGAISILCSVAYPKPFRVAGFYSSPAQSFSIDSYGQEMNCITQARIDEAKAEGIQISYEQLDTHRDPITIAYFAKKIVAEKSYDAVVGTIVSAESVTASKILGTGGIPFISPSGTHPDITKNNPFALRIPFNDYRQASLLAKLTVTELKPKRITIIRNASNLYSQFISKEYAKEINGQAPQVTVIEHPILDDFRDFEGLAKKVIEDNADLVFAPLWEPQVASLYAKLVPSKRKLTLLTSDTIDGRPEFVKLLGALSPDIRFIFSNYWNGRITGPFAQKYTALHRKSCSQYPVSRVSAAAFDAINLVVEAVRKGPTRNRGEFVKRMKDLKLRGLTGPLVFDESNDPKKPLQLFEVKAPLPTYWKEYE